MQRETWPRNGLKSGYIIAYRPTTGDSPLPLLSPKRRTPPNVVKRGQVIDLLRTIDPRLDAVRGIWFIEDNTLRMNRDDYARLQVPVAPPERYTLRLRVKRLEGNDQFAVGLIVGGHQTMCSFDAYGGSVSGLHLVDGRKVRDNPLAYRGETLAREAATEIVLRVTADSVQAEVNGTTVADWRSRPAERRSELRRAEHRVAVPGRLEGAFRDWRVHPRGRHHRQPLSDLESVDKEFDGLALRLPSQQLRRLGAALARRAYRRAPRAI